MKTVYVLVVFLLGVVLGRWSVNPTNHETTENQTASYRDAVIKVQNEPIPRVEKVDAQSVAEETKSNVAPIGKSQIFQRKDENLHNKKMSNYFSLFMDAYEKNDLDEQNKQLTEMQLLDPKHEKVYQAKVISLQDDENWNAAHETLKECIEYIPKSTYCLRRLANIRSSTTDEKLYYGNRCLEATKDEPQCLGDVAMALHTKGDYAKAKVYFEKALSIALGGEGYNRNYLLYHYGLTLESLRMYQEAKKVFIESCRLNMKIACEKAAN